MVTAAKTGVSTYATHSDRELVITRVVDAPRARRSRCWRALPSTTSRRATSRSCGRSR